MISRRLFLALTGGAILTPPSIRATENVPSLLDHMILGCNNLDTGISFVEERTGIRALFGGVHPDRGTANALLSLGERHYLEIMAPDSKGKAVPPWAAKQLDVLKTLATPRLITWAIHPRDIDALANKLRALGMQVLGPFPGSRTRPDASVLSWKTFNLADDHHGLLHSSSSGARAHAIPRSMLPQAVKYSALPQQIRTPTSCPERINASELT